jgi:hypothetical protein
LFSCLLCAALRISPAGSALLTEMPGFSVIYAKKSTGNSAKDFLRTAQ